MYAALCRMDQILWTHVESKNHWHFWIFSMKWYGFECILS
ncbi:hypothetical protein BSM4216_1006 [Bacillus smithii]|nr:hypothetical protein BSM4216_1006 [Bacillus smithii]